MKEFRSKHYVFHYHENSPAESDIRNIADTQEACFRYICDVLKTEPDFPIHYYLCKTPEEVGHYYGDGEPGNAFAKVPDRVYAVYNEKVKCIGFHEDAHLIGELIGHPEAPAIREGLAMYFDRRWWGIHNQDWTLHHLKAGRYLPIQDLLNRDYFFDHDCTITYPIMGAFTEWLISSFGIDKYLELYSYKDAKEGMKQVYRKEPEVMNREFTDYIQLFRTDDCLTKRMDELLKEYESSQSG